MIEYGVDGEDDIIGPIESVLEQTGHGMVSSFPIDPMHLLDQGVGKKELHGKSEFDWWADH